MSVNYTRKMVTLREVAEFAGTSISTTSRSLNGEPGVKKTTRAKVEAAAGQLGYRSNNLARGLRSNSSKMIGLLVPDFEKYDYTACTTLLQDSLSSAGYQLLLACHHDDPAREAEALRNFIDFRVDGIIHSPCTAEGAESAIGVKHGVPIVELFRRSRSQVVDAVLPDGIVASYELTRYLTELKHRRIALFLGRSQLITQLRDIGFRNAVSDSGLDPLSCPVFHEEHVTDAWDGVISELLKLGKNKRPTAIFAASTNIATETLACLRRLRVNVPDDMSVVSISNASWFAISQPALTVYEIPLREMGLMAGQLLLSRLEHPDREKLRPQVVSFGGEMVIRESTSSPVRIKATAT
jgi:LacI family transcriptional regulator